MCDIGRGNVTQGTVNRGSIYQDRGEGDLLNSNGARICPSGKDGKDGRVGVQKHQYWEHGLYVIMIIHDCIACFIYSRLGSMIYVIYLKEPI